MKKNISILALALMISTAHANEQKPKEEVSEPAQQHQTETVKKDKRVKRHHKHHVPKIDHKPRMPGSANHDRIDRKAYFNHTNWRRGNS